MSDSDLPGRQPAVPADRQRLASATPTTRAALPPTALPLTVTTQSRDFKNPEAWNWNFTVERELAFNSVLSVGYVGPPRSAPAARVRHQPADHRHVIAGQPRREPRCAAALQGLQLDPRNGQRGEFALQLAAGQPGTAASRKGCCSAVAYTLSKSMDNGSNQRDIIPDTYYAGNLWGPSEFDVRHVFIANFLYELPFFRGRQPGGQDPGRLAGQRHHPVRRPARLAASAPATIMPASARTAACCGIGQFWVNNGTPQIVGSVCAGGIERSGAVLVLRPRTPTARRSSRHRRRARSTCSPASAT